jgi:type II secretory pathway component GspD/PulD (secretin)
MKAANLFNFSAALLTAGMLHAQTPVDPLIESVTPTEEQSPQNPPAEDPRPEVSAPVAETPAPERPPELPAVPAAPFAPLEQQKQDMQKLDQGFVLTGAAINDIFQFLAKSANKQYFHNAELIGSKYQVTGHLNDGNPLQQMEELAFGFGLTLHTKGSTIYALTSAQLAQLPSTEFHYQLRYLRPTDMEEIKDLIKPTLSPGTGIVNFEKKTNTIIIIDSAHRIELARELLHSIDKAKGQIIVETKILRVNSTAAERTGVNWTTALGKEGTALNISRDLNSIFGLPQSIRSEIIGGEGSNVVLSPIQLSGVLRALAEGTMARQVANPILATEDNEQASISIIDRLPIITSTSTGGTGGSEAQRTEQVRYKIDSGDPTIDANPEKHREIGISVVVTPTLLPDGTIRMRLRPRSAQVVEQITSVLGNKYPRVTESMVESIARVPDGYSLVVGGFYGEAQSDAKTKIPLVGDLPVLNFFFKSKEATKEKTSLVFIVTPKSYDPTSRSSTRTVNDRAHANTSLQCDHNWVDENNPGEAHEPNLKRTLRGLQPGQAPYYPRNEELAPKENYPSNRSQLRFGKGGKS